MAASTSRQHQDRVPGSGLVAPVQSKKLEKSRKGKGKEQIPDESVRVGESSMQANSKERSYQESSAWNWISLTDSSASQHPPIFTKDGSYFFSIVEGSVKIYSVSTGQIVSTLSTSGELSDVISSATLNPHNAFQLITGSLNGRVMIWDILDGVLLQTIDISQPIHHICAHENFKDYVFVAVSRPVGSKPVKDDNGVVLRVSLTPASTGARSQVQKSSEIIAVGKTKAATGLGLSQNGAWLVAVAGHKAYVAMTSSLKAGFTKYVSPESLTCLAFHPSEGYFATGDDKGNIRLWYCLNDQVTKHAVGIEKKSQTTTLHWHAHAVSSLAFTSNGAYLLSGGEEAVLVIWQLHTGKKEFIPRVGAPIQTIGVCKTGNEEEYLLGLADSTYSFISASRLQISRSYSRIKLAEPSISRHASPHIKAPLALHSLNATIILPSSHPSSLQAYSPSFAKLISELEVSPSNRISRRDEKPLEYSRVERAVISSSGEWMATIDGRKGDDTFRGEIYLKIWRWKSGNWILNTRIDRPHGLKKVTAVAFSPGTGSNNPINLVTTGHDANVKTWRIRSIRKKDSETEEFWVTRSVFGFRSEVPIHASWSPDGSLLAVSFGPFVNLYDTVTNALRQSLSFPLCRAIIGAHFIGRTGRYIVAVGYKDIFLWDLVSGSVRWRYHCSSVIDDVTPHPIDDTFALFHSIQSPDDQRTRILVFGVSSATALRTRTVPFQFLNVLWYTLSPPLSERSSFCLVGITQSWSVVLVGDEVLSPEESEISPRGIVVGQTEQRRTLFQNMFGKSAFVDFSKESPSFRSQPLNPHIQPWTGKESLKIFDRPAYLTPPLESLYQHLMEGFLNIRAHEDAPVTDGNVEREKGHDDDMVVEDENLGVIVPATVPTKRVIGQEEMDSLVELFKEQSMKSKPPIPLSRAIAKINGPAKTKANGMGRHIVSSSIKNLAKVNGITPSSTEGPGSGDTTAEERSAPAQPSSPPPPEGEVINDNPNKRKKRKKSMG